MKPNKSKAASEEKALERELWFKTVVKIINWKEGTANKKKLNVAKISNQEWLNYCKQTLRINASSLKSNTLKKLEEVEELIKKHGGFA